eukprot:236794-Chlamydomonas_euryale.AAC.11
MNGLKDEAAPQSKLQSGGKPDKMHNRAIHASGGKGDVPCQDGHTTGGRGRALPARSQCPGQAPIARSWLGSVLATNSPRQE